MGMMIFLTACEDKVGSSDGDTNLNPPTTINQDDSNEGIPVATEAIENSLASSSPPVTDIDAETDNCTPDSAIDTPVTANDTLWDSLNWGELKWK